VDRNGGRAQFPYPVFSLLQWEPQTWARGVSSLQAGDEGDSSRQLSSPEWLGTIPVRGLFRHAKSSIFVAQPLISLGEKRYFAR